MTGGRFPEALGPAVARLRGADGTPVGTGFLLAPGTVATCAHVVAEALRTDAADEAAPTRPVTVEFPLQRGSVTYEAEVSAWRPVAPDGTGDIALLRLPGQVTAPREARDSAAGVVPLAGVGDVWDHRFRILGFPATAEHGAWIGGRLRGAVGQGWISMEADGTAYRITPGCSGAPVWDEELGAVVGMTVATDRGPTSVTAYLIPASALLDLQPGLRHCPYRGLDAFREEDAAHFFGREEETGRLRVAVDRHLVVPVVGPSGSGKTSLVRAGVLPRLRAEGHTVSEIRPLPGTRASLTLARSLGPLLSPALGVAEQERAARALADLLDTDEGAGPAALGLRLLDHCGPNGHVFFLNQLEETVSAEPATARALLAMVVALASVPADGKRLRVLATLRSASLDDLAEPATARVLSDCAQVVVPLDRAGLLRAVEGPASRVPGLTLEPGLAERIVDDALDEPGYLPMVEFALTELWSQEKGGRLTHTGYEALGGVAGALSTHAEKRVGEVIAGHGEAPVRRLFTQLARPDEAGGFTRKPVRLAPLPTEIRSAAEALATRTRFVRITHGPDGEPIVDLAHEELVRAWPRLRRWLEASRDFRAWQERLLQALAHWTATGEETGALLRGTMLATSQEQLVDPARREDITQAERDFIEHSRRHQQRGLRRWRLAAAVFVVLALLAGGLAVESWRRGTALEARGRAIASRTLAEEAGHLAEMHPVTSVRMALAAWHNARGKEARQALLDAYFKGVSAVHGYAGPDSEEIQSLDVAADGSAVVTMSVGESNAGHVRVWTGLFEGRARSWEVPGLPDQGPARIELGDDGRLLAVALADGSIRVYDLRRREPLWKAPEPTLENGGPPNVTALDFSDSGGRLLRLAVDDASESEDPDRREWAIDAWNTDSAKAVTAVPKGGTPDDAALIGEGTDVVYLSSESDTGVPGRAIVRRLASGAERRTIRRAEELAGRGSGVVVDRKYGRHALIDLTGPDATWPTFPAARREQVDVTGRYEVEDSGDGGSAVLWVTDLRTGRRYDAPIGGGFWAGLVAAVPLGKTGTPYVLLAAGADLLVVRTTRERQLPLPDLDTNGWSPDETYARSADGVYRARTDDTTEGNEERLWLVLARRGREMETEPVRLDEWDEAAAAEVFFTADSRRVVLWNRGYDMLSVRGAAADGAHERTETFSSPLVFVAPLYDGKIAVLTEEQLILYDAASGERRTVEGSPCGAFHASCFGFGVRPGHPHEVALADSDGKVVFWNVDRRQKTGKDDITMASDESGLPLVFAPSGRLLATPLSSRTLVRRDVIDGSRVGRTIASGDAIYVRALADDGTLLTDDESMELWRPQDTSEPYVTLPLTASAEDIRLTDDLLTVREANDELHIPLNPEAWHTALCRHWAGPYTPAEKEILADAGAVTDPPCP